MEQAVFDEYKAKFIQTMGNDLNTSMGVTAIFRIDRIGHQLAFGSLPHHISRIISLEKFHSSLNCLSFQLLIDIS